MARVIVSPTTGEVYKKRSQLKSICKRFARNRMAMVGLVIFLFLLIMVLTCDVFFDYQADAINQNISQRLQTPSMEHPFGTDQYGRAVLARIVYGARISLVASLCIISAATVLGALFGSLAAYYGGWVDNIIMRVMDVFYALPFNLMAICIVASIGGGIVWESKIPLHNLSNENIAQLVPQAGMTVGFDFSILDVDLPCPGIHSLRMQYSS